jgi:hypothetical protein
MIHIHHSSHDSYRTRELGIFENGLLDSDVFLQVSVSRFSVFCCCFFSLISFSPRKRVLCCSVPHSEMCLNHSLIHFSFVIISRPDWDGCVFLPPHLLTVVPMPLTI